MGLVKWYGSSVCNGWALGIFKGIKGVVGKYLREEECGEYNFLERVGGKRREVRDILKFWDWVIGRRVVLLIEMKKLKGRVDFWKGGW